MTAYLFSGTDVAVYLVLVEFGVGSFVKIYAKILLHVQASEASGHPCTSHMYLLPSCQWRGVLVDELICLSDDVVGSGLVSLVVL